MRNYIARVGVIVGVATAALLGGVANGQIWTESGDAPDLLPGQETQGSGALTQIDGFHAANDADLYKITIADAGAFSATTTGGTSLDTQLFLFDSNGFGVTSDDDDPNGGLQSRITGQFVPGPGTYYLAISAYNMDPSSSSGLIWNSSPFNVERQPDGPGAGDPLESWNSSGSSEGEYSIFLTGAEFAGTAGLDLIINGECPGNIFVSWSGAAPNTDMGVLFAYNEGSYTIPGGPCSGTELGLGRGGLRLVTVLDSGNGSGRAEGRVVACACGGFLQLIVVDGNPCSTSNVAQVP